MRLRLLILCSSQTRRRGRRCYQHPGPWPNPSPREESDVMNSTREQTKGNSQTECDGRPDFYVFSALSWSLVALVGEGPVRAKYPLNGAALHVQGEIEARMGELQMMLSDGW